MRALLLFNADFAVWPVHILAALNRRVGGLSADGVVVVDKSVSDWIRQQTTFPLRAVHCLSDLEPQWLDGETHDTAENAAPALDPGELDLIAVADRELTDAWRRGAVTALSPLRLKTRDAAARARYVHGLAAFLSSLMTANRYDVVLTYSVQDGPSVAAALLAQKHGIPFLSPKAIGFQSATCLFDDVRTMRPIFRFAFAEAEREPSAIPDASWLAGRTDLANFRDRPAGPDYMQLANSTTFERPGLLTSAALVKRSIERRAPESLRYPFPGSRLAWEWRRYVHAVRDRNHPLFRSLADLGETPFAYFPLHYEPEASLLVSAPEHVDQVAVIEAAADSLPDGWVLAVKEHRPMLGRRPGGYYDRLARIPRVTLLSPFEDGLATLRAARVTVTITGTAGFEAVLLGRPAVFLGPSPIQLVGRGFVFEPDQTRLSSAIRAAVAMPPADDATLVRFLAALDAASIHVASKAIWGGTSVITEDVVKREAHHVERFADLVVAALARS